MLARLRVASRGALHNVRHITAGDAVRMQRRREGERLREAIGTQVSTTKPELSFAPKKMVLLARQIRRLSVPEAIVQMQFSKKRASYAVSKVIQNATNLADIRHGLSPEQLEIHEAFVGKGLTRKLIHIKGRGKTGVRKKRNSHLTVKLRVRADAKATSKA